MRRRTVIAGIMSATAGVAAAQFPRGGRGGRRGFGGTSFAENPPLPKTEEEKRILSVLDEIAESGRGWQSVPIGDGRILRLLTETAGAKNVIEIGTSTGYSGLWLCLALRNTGGKLTTFEIDSRRASLAREHFKKAGVDQMVTLVEGDAHREVTRLKEPIDVIFIDADKDGYTDYLDKLLPLVRPGGLILAHNVGMAEVSSGYGEAVTTNADLDTIFLSTGGEGIAVTLKKR